MIFATLHKIDLFAGPLIARVKAVEAQKDVKKLEALMHEKHGVVQRSLDNSSRICQQIKVDKELASTAARSVPVFDISDRGPESASSGPDPRRPFVNFGP